MKTEELLIVAGVWAGELCTQEQSYSLPENDKKVGIYITFENVKCVLTCIGFSKFIVSLQMLNVVCYLSFQNIQELFLNTYTQGIISDA